MRFTPTLACVADVLTKGAIRRLARKGGVARLSPIDKTIHKTLRVFITRIIHDAVAYGEYRVQCGRLAPHWTVTKQDIVHALKKNGIAYYG